MKKIPDKVYRQFGIEPPKSAAQMKHENVEAAKNLPVEIKRKFWKAMYEDGMNLGEARKLCDLDIMVAAELVIQCHKEIYIPISVDDIK